MWLFCSLIANFCLAIACLSDQKRHIFFYTFLQCIFLSLSSLLSGRIGSFSLLLVCAVRNLLVAKGKFCKWTYYAVLVISVGLTFLIDRSWIGCIPMLATIEITVCGYRFSDGIFQTLGLSLNLFLWSVYGALVCDLPTCIVNAVMIFVCFFPKNCCKRRNVRYNRCRG